MLLTLTAIFTLYVLIKLYVNVMQIGFINSAKVKEPHLMNQEEYIKAGQYAVAKEKLAMVTTFVEYGLFLVWIGGGIVYLQSLFNDSNLATLYIVLSYILINSLLMLPLDIYEKFIMDKKFGFHKSSLALYVKDTLIGTLLTIIIGGVIIFVIDKIIVSSELWWLWSFSFIFGVIILINMFFPTIRAMFFDKLSPLEDEELKGEIQALMDKTGFVSSGVFVSDASKRDARLNAYFGGLGKSKRVVLFDTLLEKLSKKELLSVLGHELGHFAHGDIYKNIAMVGGMLFAMFALFGNLNEKFYLDLGLAQNSSSIMILFLIFMSLLSFVMMPVMGLVSRHNEFEADKTGSELGSSEDLISALKKLVTENKSFPLSHPLHIFFYYTHPPVMERIKELGGDVHANSDESLKAEAPSI